jgi:hypothetical protein
MPVSTDDRRAAPATSAGTSRTCRLRTEAARERDEAGAELSVSGALTRVLRGT